ncbi:MAG: hypothetical protein AB1758_35000, partial [Candidatus Eremiobacterota bacterium]
EALCDRVLEAARHLEAAIAQHERDLEEAGRGPTGLPSLNLALVSLTACARGEDTLELALERLEAPLTWIERTLSGLEALPQEPAVQEVCATLSDLLEALDQAAACCERRDAAALGDLLQEVERQAGRLEQQRQALEESSVEQGLDFSEAPARPQGFENVERLDEVLEGVITRTMPPAALWHELERMCELLQQARAGAVSPGSRAALDRMDAGLLELGRYLSDPGSVDPREAMLRVREGASQLAQWLP